MDLILWRHAEAEDAPEGASEDEAADDLRRVLTPRGEKQAARVAAWLDRQLPDGVRVLCSPARRCEQTAAALGRKYRIKSELAPGATADQLLEATQWPHARQAILVVGHQPVLGEAIARLLGFKHETCAVRKGSVWWLRTRERDGHGQTVLVAVLSPDVL